MAYDFRIAKNIFPFGNIDIMVFDFCLFTFYVPRYFFKTA